MKCQNLKKELNEEPQVVKKSNSFSQAMCLCAHFINISMKWYNNESWF